VSEGLKVIALGIGYLVTFGAVGSGPALVLARSAESRLLLAPALGLSIAASVLTTVSLVMPMHTAAWAVLVPVAVVSLIVAVWRLRRDRVIAARGTAIAAAFLVAGLLLAAAPALDRDTAGPFGLAVYDALGYMQADLWLQGHSLLDDPPADAGRWDLSLAYGHALTEDNTRIGVSVVNAAGASLFGQRPDETLFAFLSMLFALVPVTIWIVSRRLGAGLIAAALGACFGLSPAIFTLVGDSALANLIAVVLAPLALIFAVLGLERRDVRELVIAGILIAGLAAVYPEFIPPLVLSGAVGVALLTVRLLRRPGAWETLRGLLIGLAVMAGVVLVLAPLAAFRAYSYLSRIGGEDTSVFAGLPPRFMTVENSGAWAFGVVHLYQLQRFDLFSPAKTALAVGLPIALAALVAVGALRTMRTVSLVLVPIVVSIVLGLLAYGRYQSAHCEYCLWKSLTFMLPFLGAGLALGLDALWGFRWWRPALRIGVAALAAVAVALLLRTDVKLVRALAHSPAAGETSLRKLDDAHVRLTDHPEVLVEGAESTYAPKWTVPEAYYATRSLDDARPSLPLARDDALYLGVGAGTPPGQFYDSHYRYVLSAFPGVRSDRKPLAVRGDYGLFRRAPIDVAVVGATTAIDPNAGRGTIPWLLTPVQLWISAPRAERAGVLLRLRHGENARPLLQLSQVGNPLTTFHSRDRSQVCAEVGLRRGLTILTAEPAFPTQPPASRITEDDPLPAPPKLLGIDGIHVLPGGCPSTFRAGVRLVRFGPGWYPPEHDANGGVFRWMGSRAKLEIGVPGVPRSAMILTARTASLVRPRLLTVRARGRRLQRIAVPPFSSGSRAVTVALPPGHGALTVTLVAKPGAESAAQVTPGDTRKLAIAVSELDVRRAG
jgi:hypothetical protein